MSLSLVMDAWIAPDAVVVGDVGPGERAAVRSGCVSRGDPAPIFVGEGSSMRDLPVVHVDADRCHRQAREYRAKARGDGPFDGSNA